jgi:hypothetical protein
MERSLAITWWRSLAAILTKMMENWRIRNRRKIPPPACNSLVAGDLLLRNCDKLICIVMLKEYSAKAVWGMPGEYRVRYRLESKKGTLWAMDTEIIAGYEVLNYVKKR